MSRFGGVFWFVLVIATGMTNFLVKQAVQGLDDQLVRVRRQTADEQRKIHDLVREWTTLNQPELLANLNTTYVHLQQVSPKQVVSGVADVALRPAPPPAPPQPEAVPPIAEAAPLPVIIPAAIAAPQVKAILVTTTPAAPAVQAIPLGATPAAPTVQAIPLTTASAATLAVATAAPRMPAPALSLISTAHAASEPAARPQPAPAPKPPSLDGLFAHAAGDR
jgi:hypothetical protein